nr:DegT/DnrJ/EryC1/StrS family aminotransferase [Prochlorococcus marinus]
MINNFNKLLSPIYPFYNLYPIASCRYGIEIVLRTIVQKKKKVQSKLYVVLPAYTCQVVENAILASGCLPLYCDINETDWSISFSEFSKLLNQLKDQKKEIIAFIMQHTYGITPVDRAKIIKICELNNIDIIEDLAHCSHVFEYSSNLFDDNTTAIIGSFQSSKSISAFQGGMLGIKKNDKESNEIISSILANEKQSFSLRLLLAQIIDTSLNLIDIPFSSAKKIRSLISYFYKGMTYYEKKFIYLSYKKDFFRRGKANFITILFINIALFNLRRVNERRMRLCKIYSEKLPINNVIKSQIFNGNILILWPLINQMHKDILINNVNNNIISNWFTPNIFPNSSILNINNNGIFPNAEKLSSNSSSLHTNISKLDEYKLKRIIKTFKIN